MEQTLWRVTANASIDLFFNFLSFFSLQFSPFLLLCCSFNDQFQFFIQRPISIFVVVVTTTEKEEGIGDVEPHVVERRHSFPGMVHTYCCMYMLNTKTESNLNHLYFFSALLCSKKFISDIDTLAGADDSRIFISLFKCQFALARDFYLQRMVSSKSISFTRTAYPGTWEVNILLEKKIISLPFSLFPIAKHKETKHYLRLSSLLYLIFMLWFKFFFFWKASLSSDEPITQQVCR